MRTGYHRTMEYVQARLEQLGFDDVRPAHMAIFQNLGAEGARIGELAERAKLTNQSVGYLVDYLEEHGYVERRPDPTNRRATLVCFTERGWMRPTRARKSSTSSMRSSPNGWARRAGAAAGAAGRGDSSASGEQISRVGTTRQTQVPAPGTIERCPAAAASQSSAAPPLAEEQCRQPPGEGTAAQVTGGLPVVAVPPAAL